MLLKKGRGGWARRWCVLTSERFSFYSARNKAEMRGSVHVATLLCAQVYEDADGGRKHVFQVRALRVPASGRKHSAHM